MRKAILIYLAVLIGLFAALFVLGRQDDYAVERKAWQLYQKQIDIAKDPAVVPDNTFEELIGQYKRIIKKYEESRLAPSLHLRLGEVYLLKKDYQAARETFLETVKQFPDELDHAAEAMFKAGKSYELEGNWVEASQAYTNIIKDYPETEIALSVPIYIANYYRERNDFAKTMEAYEIAIRYYRRTAQDYEDKRVGLTALRYLSNCYLEQNRWSEAIETLGAVLEKYAPSGFLTVNDLDMTIKTINIVSAYELRDYDIAISLYRGIIARHPGRPLNNYLEQVIDAFRQLRKKGIEAKDLHKK